MKRPHVVFWGDVASAESDSNPGESLFDNRKPAEGDSWFNHGGIPTPKLTFSLNFSRFAITANCDRSGDTNSWNWQDRHQPEPQKGDKPSRRLCWYAILLSGAGNYLIDDLHKFFRTLAGTESDPARCCIEAASGKGLQAVDRDYRKIMGFHDVTGSSCKGVPVITHTYEWITPRDSPVRYFCSRPWGPGCT